MNPESHVAKPQIRPALRPAASSPHQLDGNAMCFGRQVVNGLRQEGGRRVFFQGKQAT